jgi:hypothetical protein
MKFGNFVALLLLAGGTLMASAPAHAYVIDQSHAPEIFSEWSIAFMGPVGQEFTPALSPLNVVELWISHGNAGTEPPADISVRIREGAIDGTVLGESMVVRVQDELYAPVQFTFATPIPLTLGATYVLEAVVVPDGGNPMVAGGETPDYPQGSVILLGEPVASDLWFRTGATEDLPAEATTWGGVKALYAPTTRR